MKFIEKYGQYILMAIVLIVFFGVFFIPFCIGIAKDMWQWALYGTI